MLLERSDEVRGTLTLAQAVDYVRGLKGGTINVQKGRGKGPSTTKIDVGKDEKVALNADVSCVFDGRCGNSADGRN